MYCGHCGNYLAEGSAVCPRCGTQAAEDTGSASGASGSTEDRMDPSAPSSWSSPGQPATAPLPSWSQSPQPPTVQRPAYPQGSQPTNPHAPSWSQGQGQGQQPGGQAPSWSQGQQPGPQSPSWQGQQPGGQAPSWSQGQQPGSQPPSWQDRQPGGQSPSWSQGQQPSQAPGSAWSQLGGQSGASAFKFDSKRWKRSDWITGIASLVVLISLFLPWFNGSVSANNDLGLAAQTASESGTAAHGWLWLVFIVVLLIVAYLVLTAGFGTLPVKIPLSYDQVLLIATGLNLLLVFIGFVLKPSTDGLSGVSINWGIGAYLDLVAAIVAVAVLTPPGRQRVDSPAS